MSAISKQYDPKEYEAAIYKQWEASGAFKPSEKALEGGKQPYTIMLPPPNITGNLHMGHALEGTMIDILIRYHRMLGEPTLWVPGTDSAAIATNKIINEQLMQEGTDRHKIGREAFMERVDAWYTKTGAEILNQMRRLGCSCDWQRQRFTMDDEYIQAVNHAFIEYYNKGYIYRGARLVNWDPSAQTTVSDLEIDWKMEKAPLYTFKYGPFEISTARPETKFGDKYVVMHPEDKRYGQYKHGDTFVAEWINGPITATIIKDEAADPEFGTGVMTITPWHDATDFDIAQRHNLDMEQIIGLDGKLLPIAEEFAGQAIGDARLGIVKKLEDKGLLVSINENYEHNVALNDRGKGILEPQVMRQWFVDMSKLKDKAIEACRKGDVRFYPPRWKKHFLSWMEQVHDWNINRQIWLGHRIPVWWKSGTHGTDQEEGNYVVSVDPPAGDLAGDWEQDPDVLDTWFATALWPFAALGWPNNTKDLQTFYPTATLTSARDILYLWDARMIFSGLEFMQEVPFRDVVIHPTVMAKGGQRMSKSLGTGIDPLELIEQYGADATRFGLMHQMSYDNQAIKFDEEAIKAARNFANKLWNISRLLDGLEVRDEGSVADRWIQNRLAEVTQEVTELLEQYRIGEAARALHAFIWQEYADWYLEIVKNEGSTAVARNVFTGVLKLLHPFMPHITEVLWQHQGKKGMLITEPWPQIKEPVEDQEAFRGLYLVQDVTSTTRSARTLLGIRPGKPVEIYSSEPIPLLNATAAMTGAEFVDQKTDDMRPFPFISGRKGSIFIGSPEITEESLQAARDKLARQEKRAQELLFATQQMLTNMRGKVPKEKIAEKEALLEQTQQNIESIRQSKHLLS